MHERGGLRAAPFCRQPPCTAKWPPVLPPAATVSCLRGPVGAPALTASSAGAAAAGHSPNHGTFAVDGRALRRGRALPWPAGPRFPPLAPATGLRLGRAVWPWRLPCPLPQRPCMREWSLRRRAGLPAGGLLPLPVHPVRPVRSVARPFRGGLALAKLPPRGLPLHAVRGARAGVFSPGPASASGLCPCRSASARPFHRGGLPARPSFWRKSLPQSRNLALVWP